MITPEKDAAQEPYTLLAMAQSGEISIVQNGVPRVWMMSIYYPSHKITREHNGWILCEQIFLTWDELYQYVKQNALVSNWRPQEYAQYDANIREESTVLASDGKSRQQVLQALHRVEQRIIAAGCLAAGKLALPAADICRTCPR